MVNWYNDLPIFLFLHSSDLIVWEILKDTLRLHPEIFSFFGIFKAPQIYKWWSKHYLNGELIMIYHVFIHPFKWFFSDRMKDDGPNSRGQPALLYLVPCTLGLTLLLSLCRDAWMAWTWTWCGNDHWMVVPPKWCWLVCERWFIVPWKLSG